MTAEGALPGRLLTPTARFLGREREAAEIVARLAAERLLTLIGAPGVGKTRLATHVAELVRGRFPDGVWFIDLTPLARPEQVPAAVAVEAGVQVAGSQSPGDALAARLQGENALLVLDTCEHLLDASAGLVRALLQRCPGLRVLATSREPLRVPGEAAWYVPPLTLPEPLSDTPDQRGIEPVQVLLGSEAGRLFVERAQAARPGFNLMAEDAWRVAEICRRLDGIPLAIEMAAGRAGDLSVAEIAEQVHDGSLMFAYGSTGLSRHRTLGAAVAWSYTLLADGERALLRHLSVIAGWWRLEAIEAVRCRMALDSDCREDGAGKPVARGDSASFGMLTSLVDASLVMAEAHDGEMRYRLLEIVRAFAAERLSEAGEDEDGEAIRERHHAWWPRPAAPATTAPNRPDVAIPLRQCETTGGLTPREQEVAILVARGLSNREVGAALVLSRRTVEWHVKNLLEKLGLRSRTQLVRWVAENVGGGRPERVARGGTR